MTNDTQKAESLGLLKAAQFLDRLEAIDVDDVFVDDNGQNGIELRIESKDFFILKRISQANDKFDLKVEEYLRTGKNTWVKLVSTKDAEVNAI